MTDERLGESDHWPGTRTGAGGTATVAYFLFSQSWPQEQQLIVIQVMAVTNIEAFVKAILVQCDI